MADNFFFFGAIFVLLYALLCSCKLVWEFFKNSMTTPPIVDFFVVLGWAVLQVGAFSYLVTGGACGR